MTELSERLHRGCQLDAVVSGHDELRVYFPLGPVCRIRPEPICR